MDLRAVIIIITVGLFIDHVMKTSRAFTNNAELYYTHCSPPLSHDVKINNALLSTLEQSDCLQYFVGLKNAHSNIRMIQSFPVTKPKGKELLLKFLFTILLLQAGDLECNPGPYKSKYPCTVCNKACKWSQQAVRCDSCNLWTHKDCMGMNTMIYDYIGKPNVTWICCQCGLPNFSSSLFNNTDFVHSNPFSPSDETSPIQDTPPLATSSPKPGASLSAFSFSRHESSTSSTPGASVSGTCTSKEEGSRKLKVVSVNCQSVKEKTRELGNLILTTDPDIILGQESWLNDNIFNGEVFPDNYEVIRKDRTTTRGGGVFILYRNDLILTHRPDFDTDCEVLWAQLQMKGSKSLFVGSFYRPPSDKDYSMDQFNKSITKVVSKSKSANILVAGDFNLGDIDWTSNSVKKYANKGPLCRKLLDISNDYCLSQMVTDPTHRTEDTENILDLVFTSNPTAVEDVIHMPGLGICKHDTLMTQLNLQPQKARSPPRKIHMYKKLDSEAFVASAEKLQADFFSSNIIAKGVEKSWLFFRRGLQKIIDSHIPTKKVRPSRDLPWMTRALKSQIRRKCRWFKKAKKVKSSRVWDKYKAVQKETRQKIRKAYQDYMENTLAPNMEENPKIFWRFIKALKRDSGGIATLRDQGQLISDSHGKAEILNHYFKSVFTKEDTTHAPNKGTSPFPEMGNFTVTTAGVIKLLNEPAKAAGPDGLPSRVLKLLANQIAPILTAIFNGSLQEGVLPRDWKVANVTPIYKKGEKANPMNYRPVSLTSICCKVLEHVIHSQVMKHLDSHHILSDTQHGFRKRRSCDTQLVITTDDLARGLDNRKQTDIIILDFSKAFDTVPHTRLINKLTHYGINRHLIKWITSFLTNRQQKVVLEGQSSSYLSVDSGVPQGTVLGPLLFLLYINDLPENLTSTPRLFADDCLLYRTISSDKDAADLQMDLDELTKWQEMWQMRFNASKCYVMHMSTARTTKSYNYKQIPIRTLEYIFKAT